MTWLDSLWLGLVQALTEFLPVSSSGHLQLMRALFGLEIPGGLLFDLLLHLGTLAAVLLAYRERLAELGSGLVQALRGQEMPGAPLLQRLRRAESVRLLVLLGIASIPTAVLGLLLKDLVESPLFSARVVGVLMLLNAGQLWFSRRLTREEPPEVAASALAEDASAWRYAGIGPAQALVIGLLQGVAVLPGISRSGTTIVAALALGADRMRAAEFSFFLSIPVILGATLVSVLRADEPLASGSWGVYLVGMAVAAAVGYAALRFLLRLLGQARLHHFAWYCLLVGLAAILLSW